MGHNARARAYLVAPDSFKGTFTSREVSEAMARGVRAAGAEADRCPLADGGEGTMEVLLDALGGEPVSASAHDPLGREIKGRFGWLEAEVAVVEVAEASGLGLVEPARRDAEGANSRGTGELIVAAVARGARRILVAAGGSATTDGGAGAIAVIREAGGLSGARLVVLCDVRTPFEDAATVFAPQKGADEAAVLRLSGRLDELAGELPRDPRGVEMTGAAGGLAGGLWAAFGAELRAGAPAVMEAVGFDRRLQAADSVITGEGRLDEQSLEGKLVGEVAGRCRAQDKPLHVIAGQVADDQVGDRLAAASVSVASALAGIEAAARRSTGR